MAMTTVDDFAIPHTVLRHFDLSSTPYTGPVVDDISRRRAAFPNQQLFFDQLAEFVDIEGPALYPPTTPAAVRRLLHVIHTSPADRLKRDCFFYYLLRDYADSTHAAPNGDADMSVDEGAHDVGARAKAFAKTRCMPAAWVALMDGYWALDHGLWEAAVDALSDPRIPDVNFVSDILLVLSSSVSPPARAAKLVHTLLTTTPRPLATDVDHDVRLIATAATSGLSAAFGLIRTLHEPLCARGRADVWSWALGAPRVPVGAGAHTAQSLALKELLHLPLTDNEHAHLLDFLARPPRAISAPALSLLHDLVALRLVHQGQYAETLALDRALAGRGADADRQRRRETVREFIDILPEAQKRVLRVDAATRKDDQPLVNGHKDADVDMASSWVEVELEPVPVPELAHVPVAPTPIRAGLRQDARPASPARIASPFSGPPRFAAGTPNLPAPSAPSLIAPSSPAVSAVPMRLASPVKHSASPFAPPKLATPAKKAKAQPKKMIVDDDEPLPVLRRSVRQSVEPEQQAEPSRTAYGDAEMEEAPPARTPARRTRRAVSTTREASAAPSTPAATPARRTRRQATVPPDIPEPINEMPPPPIPGSFVTSPAAAGPHVPMPARTPRARITRSASRAHLDDDDAVPKRPKSAVKSATRAISELTDEGSVAGSTAGVGTRRTTRRGTSVAHSEAGSPTPSVASTAARSDAGRRRKEVSATPRATRSKK
ncbi:hypothetical protein Q5752_001685 [Cryptotrichosporon argae]